MQPTDSCGLNPSAGLRLHFFRVLELHELEAFELVEASDTNEVLCARDHKNTAALMDVHKGLNPCAVERPSVDHWSLLQLILRIDFVNHLQDQLLHHERTWFCQVNTLVQFHALSLLGLPDLLRNGFAKPSVDFNIGELEFLVQLVKVLVIDDHEHVAFREDPLLELVVEFLLLSS